MTHTTITYSYRLCMIVKPLSYIKQEWKSLKKGLGVQCVIKQPFCLHFLLIVAPSNCYREKHEQGVE